MKKSATALATLVTVAGLAGGAAATAQAHPATLAHQASTPHTSTVAMTRLHALLQTPSTVVEQGIIRPNDWGTPGH
jgi:hypothetical protein